MTSFSEPRRQTALLRATPGATVNGVAWDFGSLVGPTAASTTAAPTTTASTGGGTAVHDRWGHCPGGRAEAADEGRGRGSSPDGGGLAGAWEVGREAGYRAGLLEAEREQAAWVQQRDERERRERQSREAHWNLLATAVLEAVELASRELQVDDVQATAARVGVEIAEALVGHHLRVADCSALDAVLRALGQAPRDGAVTVRLHPDDAAVVAASATELAPGRPLEVLADPAVEVGGCVVDVGERTVDAQLGAALRRVREVLER